MTYEDLVSHVAFEYKLSKRAADRVVRGTFSAIKEYVLDGGRVVMPGFGSFRIRAMRAKGKVVGREWSKPERVTIRFKPSCKAQGDA